MREEGRLVALKERKRKKEREKTKNYFYINAS